MDPFLNRTISLPIIHILVQNYCLSGFVLWFGAGDSRQGRVPMVGQSFHMTNNDRLFPYSAMVPVDEFMSPE
jgi:hypothetical protein